MKGLLIKDFKLIKTQKSFLIIVAFVCILIVLKGSDISPALSYAGGMLSIIVVNTIVYDELDNGMGFLFTFPVSRKIYVLEKYVFGIITLAAIWIVGSAAMLAAAVTKGISYSPQEWLQVILSTLLIMSVILSFTLPVQLKFGADKARIALLIIIVCIVAAGYAIQLAADAFSVDLEAFAKRFLQADAVEVTVCLIILAVGLLGISYFISVSILRKKQF